MFLDLDRFKDINDTLDHSIGDALLIELAKCLCLALPEEDTVTRLGGDEFILFAWGRCTRSRACGAKITEYYCRVLSDWALFLYEQSCDEMQDYQFGKPVPIEQFDALLKQSFAVLWP